MELTKKNLKKILIESDRSRSELVTIFQKDDRTIREFISSIRSYSYPIASKNGKYTWGRELFLKTIKDYYKRGITCLKIARRCDKSILNKLTYDLGVKKC